MLRFGRRTVTRSRALLAWTLALAAASQVTLGAFLRRAHPELCDPEIGTLVQTLRARLAEAPGRPLVLFLGSSRMANLIRPGALPAPAGPAPVFFNFGTVRTGPLRELQVLNRLLARGIRPAWVVAEVWPPHLTHGDRAEEPKLLAPESQFIQERDLEWADAGLLVRHVAGPWPGICKLLEAESLPACRYGRPLLVAFGPFAVATKEPLPCDWADPRWRAEGCGWLPSPMPRPEPALYRVLMADSADKTRKFLQDFAVTAVAGGALRELVETCARREIRLALLLAPEHALLRGCYSPEIEDRVAAYLGDLGQEWQVPVVDARDWVHDGDFLDLTHVLPHAAGPFTERFGREALLPLLAGGSPDPALLYPHAPSLSRPSPGEAAEFH
jgi:hypothetical protein